MLMAGFASSYLISGCWPNTKYDQPGTRRGADARISSEFLISTNLLHSKHFVVIHKRLRLLSELLLRVKKLRKIFLYKGLC